METTLKLALFLLVVPLSASPQTTEPEPSAAKSWFEIHTPVGDPFHRALETRSSHDADSWTAELTRFYRTDGTLVYRGVCNDASRTLSDFLHMFATYSDNLMSKGTGNGFRKAVKEKSDFDLRRAMFADLARFNHDAYAYSLSNEVGVHQLGPVAGNETAYEESYGFSTSWSFWMAAEFAGIYPGDKECDNSMLFGMYPAHHFIDYKNLEAVDASFKRRYPDEREVLGVGAADPDSLVLIARMERRGQDVPVITEVMFRNPVKPTEILYFEGAVDVLAAEVAEGWALLQRDEREIEAAFQHYGVRPPTPPSIPEVSPFRLVPGKPVVVHRDGRPLEPTRRIELHYDDPLFPKTTPP